MKVSINRLIFFISRNLFLVIFIFLILISCANEEYDMLYLYGLILLFFRVLWEFLYMNFFIFPYTNLKGDFAHNIEMSSFGRWVLPQLTKNKNDVLFVGNSHVIDGINPGLINQICKIRSFNLAFYFVPFVNALEVLVLYKCYPKLVVVDVSTRYSVYEEMNLKRTLDKYNNFSKLRFAIWNVSDRIHSIIPSYFIHFKYRPVVINSIKRLKKFRQSKKITPARYSPFKKYIGYKWALHKKTNHRVVIRYKKKSVAEIGAEERYLKKCIEETRDICNIGSAAYKRSFERLYDICHELKDHGVQLLFLRLPLDPRMIKYENEDFSGFFNDIRKAAHDFNANYLDLSEKLSLSDLQFYTDGLHLESKGATVVSNFLGEYINNNYKLNTND